MVDYLREFDEARHRATSAERLIETLRQKYPTLRVPLLLQWSAQRAFEPNPPPL